MTPADGEDFSDEQPLGVVLGELDDLRKRSLSDTKNAERWAARNRGRFRMHAAKGQWMRWTGKHWAEDVEGGALLATKEVADDYYVEAMQAGDPRTRQLTEKHAQKTESAGARTAMLTLAEAEPGMSAGAAAFDADPWALNCLNGTLDLQTGALRPHDSTELHTKIVPVAFDPSAVCPRFDAFISQILPDPEVRAFVQRLFGYMLTGVVREHVLPVFYGTGGNGKGTLVELFIAIMGPYAKAIPADLLMRKPGGGGEQHPTERASLLGLRAAFASESDENRHLAEATVKMLTGGDTISARYMRQDFFEFQPTHKIILSTNHKPIIKGTDKGIWRRVRLIPFVVGFDEGKANTRLKLELLEEAPGVLAWAVRGCMEWQKIGLGTAGAIKAATDGYRRDSDKIGQFLDECCVRVDNARTLAGEVFASYKRWCDAQNEHVGSQKQLGTALTERGFERVPVNGIVAYAGLGLRDDRDDREGFSGLPPREKS